MVIGDMRLAAIALVIAAAVLADSDPNGEEPGLDKAVPFQFLPPRGPVMRDLLETVCPGRVFERNGILACDQSATESDDSKALWGVDGFMLGHFIGPNTEDAVVSGSRFENHPDRWGGTLLLTRTRGYWRPVWYRSGVITRHCLGITTESGRQVLACASGYFGMGHQTTTLYLVALGSQGADEQVLLVTDTFNWAPTVAQRQQLAGIELVQSHGGSILRVRIRHGRIRGKAGVPDPGETTFPTTTYVLNFVLHGTHLQLTDADKNLFANLFKTKS